jgi:AcrR family transcriptional regulator
MATRATQLRILETALALFNAHGTAAVSVNRIATHCGISKGNLQYHFRDKREVIRALFQEAVREMDAGWYRDHLVPTLEHMATMYVRQLQLIARYRFFYRELAELLHQDLLLRRCFARNRERRLGEIEKFMLALQDRGLMRFPADPERLRMMLDVTWILSENWLNYLGYHDRELTVEALLEGYAEILEVLRPYFCTDPQHVTRQSYHAIESLVSQRSLQTDTSWVGLCALPGAHAPR